MSEERVVISDSFTSGIKARLEHEKDLEEGSTIRTSRRVCSTKIKVRGERVDQLEEVDRSHKGSFILISDKLS